MPKELTGGLVHEMPVVDPASALTEASGELLKNYRKAGKWQQAVLIDKKKRTST